MTDKVYEITGDLIKLSDLFRRMARFGQPELAKELVERTRRFGNSLTWLYGEIGMDNEVNHRAVSMISEEVSIIAGLAKEAGIFTVLLPIHADSPYAEIVRDHVLAMSDFDVDFQFRKDDYSEDLDEVGVIRKEISTFLDDNVRSLGAIDPALKGKWDRDTAAGGQYRFDF